MSNDPSTTPATEAGTTAPAGEGVEDQEMLREVAESTSSDLRVEEAFARESDGTSNDVAAADQQADDLT